LLHSVNAQFSIYRIKVTTAQYISHHLYFLNPDLPYRPAKTGSGRKIDRR
jgi:hypothetical protein